MNPMTCIALLLVFSARPIVPPAALPEAVEAGRRPSSPPGWPAQATVAWRGPWIMRPDLYDHRYITW
ncbi:MAG: hypothetical protein E6J88_14830 [Deltaproteobacteria bacterium]|nr:MAG: hypothetical protein E6J88_14830 [Deltaproteobacteria bacterium]